VLPRPSFASLGRRLGAYFLDVIISGSVVFAVAFSMRALRALGLWMPVGERIGESYDPVTAWHALGAGAKLSILLGFVLSMGPLYLALFESSAWQASLGKRLLDIYVTDNEGRRISIARAFGRWFWKVVLLYFWINLASLFTVALTKDKKAIHDMLAKTRVLRGRPTPRGFIEPWRIACAFGIPFVYLLATFLLTL
jgi:uncharacterized RDD family membrane protein YckC